jgi:hypothetical protein
VIGVANLQLSCKDLIGIQKLLEFINFALVTRDGQAFRAIEACNCHDPVNFTIDNVEIRLELKLSNSDCHHGADLLLL